MQAISPLLELAPLSALILGAIALGGGVYETLLIDRAWPNNPAIIQPSRGGINRGLFWAPINTLYELALAVAAWSAWGDREIRWWVLAALITHLVARAWSFAYFIPNAIRFEKSAVLTEDQRHLAVRWIRLSRCRPALQTISLVGLCAAVAHAALRNPTL